VYQGQQAVADPKQNLDAIYLQSTLVSRTKDSSYENSSNSYGGPASVQLTKYPIDTQMDLTPAIICGVYSMRIFDHISYTSFFFAFTALTLASPLIAEEVPPGYNTPVPAKIMTPDEVDTRIGTLLFEDGRPTDETVATVYENLDFLRGVETFLNYIPMASLHSLYRGHVEQGLDASNKFGIAEDLLDSNPLFLTGNTDTVYGQAFLDLQKDGPTVIEIPAGMGPSTVNDAYFRFVADMGAPGLDRGKGGKYLILPPDYDGTLAPPVGGYEAIVDGEKYFVSKSRSYINWFIARGFLVDGKTDTAVAAFKNGLRIYPLAMKDNPPEMEFINLSKRSYNTIHANNYEFFHEIDEVIQREPVSMMDPELLGLAASIGIQKGAKFDPDPRMKKILEDAVEVGNATARAIWLSPRLEGVKIYDDRQWTTAFVGGSYQWLSGEQGEGGRNLDARSMFFYMATVNTPAMVLQIPGVGSQYGAIARDVNGKFLQGDTTYRLNIPADVPAKDFWSVVIYDPQTRSELQTDQPFPSLNSQRNAMKFNDDGSVDIYFGPQAPEGYEPNWIQTVPGKGWFAILRLYGPLEPWFEKSWRPGDIEPL
jgi:hypothetical protein